MTGTGIPDARLAAELHALRQQNGELEAQLIKLRAAEAELRKRDRGCRSLLEAVPDMMFRIRRDGTYLEFVPGKNVEPVLLPDLFLGRRIHDVMPPAFADQAMHFIERALETGQIQAYEYQLPVRGELRDYEARVSVSGTDEVLALVRDITERPRK